MLRILLLLFVFTSCSSDIKTVKVSIYCDNCEAYYLGKFENIVNGETNKKIRAAVGSTKGYSIRPISGRIETTFEVDGRIRHKYAGTDSVGFVYEIR